MPVINTNPQWADFVRRGDGLEVAPVVFGADFTERTQTRSRADAWGVYVHLPEGGVEWIADYTEERPAYEFAEWLMETHPNLGWHGIMLDVTD